MEHKKKEKINLLERVEMELIVDMPSLRKKKGDVIKTHPKNVQNLVDKKVAKAASKKTKEVSE